MRRKISCPIMFSNLSYENRADYLVLLKETEAERVFIATGRDFIFTKFDNQYEKALKELGNHIQYFKQEGLEVGIWVNSFGFGNPLSVKEAKVTTGMTKIKSILGKEVGDAFCPEDSDYVELFCYQLRRIAELNPTMIMLDDDLCLSVRPGIGCFCDKHIALLEEELGYPVNFDSLFEEMFSGARNELRDAWLKVMGNTLRKFCRMVRKAVDSVNTNIRMGFCAGYTSWDIEGVTASELSHILAGNTKPFLRFTGAPYWVSKMSNRFPGQRLHNVIEFAREQEVWCREEGIEIFNEADSYPRARYQVPANLLECFDAATVASSDMDTLKYLFDYFSDTNYETGYIRIHKKNKGLYEFLEKHFNEKETIGVQVYERMRKIADMELSAEWNEKQIMTTELPVAAAILTSNGIPVTYEKNAECAVAFNVNVDMIEEMPKRLIIDVVAAKRLQEKGIDVGLEEMVLIGTKVCPSVEVFEHNCISIAASKGRYFDCKLKEGANIESYFEVNGRKIPASYTYKKDGVEYLVYTFDAYSIPQSGTVFCSYGRQAQLFDFYSDFPIVRKSPYLYQLCKRNENETVAFFANIFEDEMFEFDIELDQVYQEAECYGIDASLNRTVLHVNSEVAPYGMFAIRLVR